MRVLDETSDVLVIDWHAVEVQPELFVDFIVVCNVLGVVFAHRTLHCFAQIGLETSLFNDIRRHPNDAICRCLTECILVQLSCPNCGRTRIYVQSLRKCLFSLLLSSH